MSADIKQIGEMVEQKGAFVQTLFAEIDKVIVGQRYMLERMLLAMLSNGHVLLEGVPGLAKTLSVTMLSKAIKADFKRIQFTPDLLPADVVGTQIYRQSDGEFYTRSGPIFANIILIKTEKINAIKCSVAIRYSFIVFRFPSTVAIVSLVVAKPMNKEIKNPKVR